MNPTNKYILKQKKNISKIPRTENVSTLKQTLKPKTLKKNSESTMADFK